MRHAILLFVALVIALLAPTDQALAHALAQRYDLPLPLNFFLVAAAAAVALSFVVLALFRRGGERPSVAHDATFVDAAIPQALVSPLRFIGVAALVLIVAAGLVGDQRTFKNIAPVSVWVLWWVGFALLAAFIGDFWALINPWRSIFDAAQALTWGRKLSRQLSYPRTLGAWPACALFLLFVWIELVAPGRDVPRNVAVGIVLYSALTWGGFALFGRDVWVKNGEVFSILFSLLGRFAPLRFSDDGKWRLGLRFYGGGLLQRQPLSPSMTGFVLLMLATVTVDGLMETPFWAAVAHNLMGGDGTPPSAASYAVLQSALLLAAPVALASLYGAVIAVMARIAQTSAAKLSGVFVLSLVPIAIAYHLAHYFSLLAVAGQFIIPLASDPFGFGWDLFGTTLYRIDIGIVDAKFIWYMSVGAIVTGHIVAVWVGHRMAYALFADQGRARRSQYPMLALMVGYTMLSLWILAQPIVELGVK